MKCLIDLVKTYWKGFIGLFRNNPNSYYYGNKMDGLPAHLHNKVLVDKNCCSGTDCGCKDTSDYTYEEPVSDFVPETTPEPIRTKEQLRVLSKLELQVMAENAGITLGGKEKKQQILNKLVKHLAL